MGRTPSTVAALTALLLGTVAMPAAAADQAPTGSEAVAPLVQPSIVYLTTEWTGYVYDQDVRDFVGELDATGAATPMEFTAVTRCTGFVVNPDGWIGTAAHCVDTRDGKDALREQAMVWALENGYYVQGTTFQQLDENQDYLTYTFDDDGEVVRNSVERKVTASWAANVSGLDVAESTPARVDTLRRYEDGDVALLKVDSDGLNAIPLADGDVDINDEVQSVGYPAIVDNFTDQNLVPTFNPGTVSSEKTVADGLLSVLQLSAPIRGGMSGGPTVNLAGEVVGVNSASFDGEPFNYAVPVDNMRQVLNSAGVENTLSETTQAYRRGVLALLVEDKPRAVRNLSLVVDEQPANGLAQEYLDQARDLPDPPPPAPAPEPSGTSPLVWVGLAAVVLALAVVIGFLLLRRRPSRAGPGSASATPTSGGWSGTAAEAGASGAPSWSHDRERSGDGVSAAHVGFSAPTGSAMGPRRADEPGVDELTPTHPASAAVDALSIPDQRATRRFCSRCGTQAAAATMRFCGECGAPL